jgi:hypothetical protein
VVRAAGVPEAAGAMGSFPGGPDHPYPDSGRDHARSPCLPVLLGTWIWNSSMCACVYRAQENHSVWPRDHRARTLLEENAVAKEKAAAVSL